MVKCPECGDYLYSHGGPRTCKCGALMVEVERQYKRLNFEREMEERKHKGVSQ